MKRISFLLIITMLAISGCQKPDNENGIPDCVEEMITDFNNNEA